MQLLRNKKILIALAAFALLVIIALAVNTSTKNNDKETAQLDKGQTYDPDTDSTISDPPGKDVDIAGSNADAPTIAGTSVLIDDGISIEQEDSLKYALYDYFGGKSKKISRIAVVVSSVTPVPYDPNSTADYGTINFDLRVNQKDTYTVTLNYYSDLESVQVIIKSYTGEQLHDSGIISGKTLDDKVE